VPNLRPLWKRATRAIFNRWTLTVVTAIFSIELLSIPNSPLSFVRYQSDRIVIRYKRLDQTRGPSISLVLAANPMGREYWKLDNGEYFLISTNLIMPEFQTGDKNGGTIVMVTIPLVSPIALCMMLTTYLHGRARGRRSLDPTRCRNCRYPLESLAENQAQLGTATCPECGTLNIRAKQSS
jgi:hypothetical protein